MAKVKYTWHIFIDTCLRKRLATDDYDKLARDLRARIPKDGAALSEALLRPKTLSAFYFDPLVVVYLERSLALDLLDPPHILEALFRHAREANAATDRSQPESWNVKSQSYVSPELEELVFARLSRAYMINERPKKVSEAQKTLALLTKWMSTMSSTQAAESVINSIAEGTQGHRTTTIMSLGLLVIAVLEHPKIAGVLEKASPKWVSKALSESITAFMPHLSQASLQLADRLGMLQKQYSLTDHAANAVDDGSANNGLDVAVLQLETVMDLPVINTRAGLYVFINSILAARPLTDDHMILNYLQARYKGDIQSLAIDLITASFDVLAANSAYRSETNETLFNFRSFLVNKVPTLLTVLASSMFSPLTPEMCITQALNHIDRNAFPSFSQAFGDGVSVNSALSDVRQDFLFACALHQLIPEASIERLLGETPMNGVSEKHVKENLVAQCSNNFERVEEYLNEMEAMDGNAGTIVAAMTEVIRNLCMARDTVSLKTICNALSRKPRSLDVILQYTSPASILQPLCQLLDSWKHEEEQSEYQPVYDEFGAVLLLIQAFVLRHDLKSVDLGVEDGSFIAQLIERGHVSIVQEELSEEQKKYLDGWVRGLYGSDGISDDLLKSCRPQDFYLLVPTIFNETVYACSVDAVSIDEVKSGLEFLLETFLLPSLVGAVFWMTSRALEQTPKEIDITLQILSRLIRPASISGDAQAIHSSIVSMVARRLEHCLRKLQYRYPSRSDISGLLDIISSSHDYERTPYCSFSEIDAWIANSGGSFRHAIKFSFHNLIIWNGQSDINPTPPPYSHRQLFSALQIVGVCKVLRAILEEIKNQTANGTGAVALDVAVNLICAPLHVNSCTPVSWLGCPVPSPNPLRTTLNLREMLKQELDDPTALMADPALAEAAVRLHRRVEAQLAGPQLEHLPTAGLMQGIEMTATGVDMGMGVPASGDTNAASGAQASGAAAVAAGGDIADDLGLGATGAGTGIDGLGDASGGLEGLGSMDDMLDGAAAAAATDDDVFSGLVLEDEYNF
ncbi:mediator of RNA polymerase II transcription subunit 5 [Phyllosticta citricarpa]|uniref:Mediator of RNA polymerase II transcription subunit 5 n=1 Tax=Phyllosticta citricarpa TaxID=55181 RepID=A0ABR1MJC4_9PEZI